MALNKTLIDWVKNPDGTQGYTWNPITGCLNHVDGMCKGGNFPCYAYRLANGRLKERYLANINIATSFMDINKVCDPDYHQKSGYTDPFYPRFWEDRLRGPIHIWKPRGIFCCDMGELFGSCLGGTLMAERVMAVIRSCPQHRFYLLTKQPQNLIKFSPFPDNCWVGVTATNHDGFLGAITELRRIKAKVKYISFEPLLKEIPFQHQAFYYAGINWLIIGAQTRPTVYPKIDWVEEIVGVADKAGIPVFLKDNLRPLIAQARKDKGIWGAEHLIRQEMPSG